MALDDNPDMPTVLRRKIALVFREQFGLDLGVDQVADDAIDKVRNVAFLLARQVLIREKTAGYAEQFQGMYALARGLVIVFAVACAYWLGDEHCAERASAPNCCDSSNGFIAISD
jgi:hypothetical protein